MQRLHKQAGSLLMLCALATWGSGCLQDSCDRCNHNSANHMHACNTAQVEAAHISDGAGVLSLEPGVHDRLLDMKQLILAGVLCAVVPANPHLN